MKGEGHFLALLKKEGREQPSKKKDRQKKPKCHRSFSTFADCKEAACA